MSTLISNRLSFQEGKSLQQDDLYVKSEVVKLSDLTGIPSRKGLDRAIVCEGEIVNIVSQSYGHLPNEIFFYEAERKLIEADIAYDVRSINRNNRSFAMDLILNDPNVVIELKGGKDKIRPMLRFVNAYDGSIRTSGSFGFFREVCSNGLHVAESKIGFAVKHSSGVQEVVLPEIKSLVKRFIDNEFYTLRRRFEVMYDCIVDDPQSIVKEVCKRTGVFKYESSEKNPNPSANARLVLEVANREADLLGVEMNNWILYNSFNYVLHNKLQKSFTKSHAIDAELFEVFAN